MSGVVTPQNMTYNNRSAYITASEFRRSPIAAAIDTTQLIPGGDLAVQDHALTALIAQASAAADTYCLGAIGTLGASVNVETGRVRPNRYGQFIIHPAFWPILEVQSFGVGSTPASVGTIPLTSNNCWIEQRQFTITATSYSTTTAGPLDLSGQRVGNARPSFAKWQYVNGFYNQTLAADATAGATSITVTDTTGLYAGQTVTIYDAPVEEAVTIASSWNGSTTTVPLVSALAYGHGDGTNVSAMPPSIKQAVTHLAVGMIKQRGQGGIVLNEIGQPTAVSATTQTSPEDLGRAYELLDPYRQIWGRG